MLQPLVIAERFGVRDYPRAIRQTAALLPPLLKPRACGRGIYPFARPTVQGRAACRRCGPAPARARSGAFGARVDLAQAAVERALRHPQVTGEFLAAAGEIPGDFAQFLIAELPITGFFCR